MIYTLKLNVSNTVEKTYILQSTTDYIRQVRAWLYEMMMSEYIDVPQSRVIFKLVEMTILSLESLTVTLTDGPTFTIETE